MYYQSKFIIMYKSSNTQEIALNAKKIKIYLVVASIYIYFLTTIFL